MVHAARPDITDMGTWVLKNQLSVCVSVHATLHLPRIMAMTGTEPVLREDIPFKHV